MRAIVLLIALVGLSFTIEIIKDPSDVLLKPRFDDFAAKFNKKYASEEEYNLRFQIFKENVAKIEEYQRLAVLYKSQGKVGITKFADMTEEEFKNTVLMAPSDPEPCSVPSKAQDYNLEDLPTSYDWTEKGAVTPVKDQGSVGTCWAFSTTGNIEGQWFLAGHPLVALSEEQLSDCDGNDCGVFGGFPCRAMQYVMEVGGIMSEQDYPYCVGTGACYPCAPPHYNKTFCGPGPEYCNATLYPCKANKGSNFAAKISGYKNYADPTQEDDLAGELINVGPLSICMNAGSGIPPLQFHESGVYDPWTCDADALDHAVLLVGYGVESGIISDTPYWLVKNSWGTDWSDKGYFKILRGKGTCGVNRWISTAIVN